MEAAEALCPREARLYKEGGAALAKVVRLSDQSGWAELRPDTPDEWLADRLLAALCERPDLQLTGRDLAHGIHAPRFRLPRDLLLAAVKKSDDGYSEYHLSLLFTAISRLGESSHQLSVYGVLRSGGARTPPSKPGSC